MCLIYTHSVVAVHARHNEVCGRFCGLRLVWMLDFSLFIQGCFPWILRILCENKTNESVSMCKWSLCGHLVLEVLSHTEFTEFADFHFCSCNCLSFRLSRIFFPWILCARCGAEHSVAVWPGACPVGSGMCRVVYSSASFPWAKGECHKVGRGMAELSVIVGLRIWRRWCIGA